MGHDRACRAAVRHSAVEKALQAHGAGGGALHVLQNSGGAEVRLRRRTSTTTTVTTILLFLTFSAPLNSC
jgi:hypothetical protein